MEQGLGRLWNKLASTAQVSSSNKPSEKASCLKSSPQKAACVGSSRRLSLKFMASCRPSGLQPWEGLGGAPTAGVAFYFVKTKL